MRRSLRVHRAKPTYAEGSDSDLELLEPEATDGHRREHLTAAPAPVAASEQLLATLRHTARPHSWRLGLPRR